MKHLRKRAHEDRLFVVDLKPSMRDGDTLSAITSIAAVEDDATVTISSISADADAGTVAFLASAGEVGEVATLRVRWTTTGTPTQNLERLVELEVTDALDPQ